MKFSFLFTLIVLFQLEEKIVAEVNEYDLNLPPEHMGYYFSSHPNASEACENSPHCSYKSLLNLKKCWGYEGDCPADLRYSTPICNKSSKGWAKSKEEQIDTFFKQGDFGYIRERKEELLPFCISKQADSSFLECSKYLRFCRGRNIMFDFKTLEDLPEPMRYRDDVIREGQVGGYCMVDKKLLKQQGQHKSPLQSWYAEFEHFVELSEPPNNKKHCDIIIHQPTFIMKLDATVNMYHHFCDFLNLYATLHLNDTFSTDIQVLIWDTIPYGSNFAAVWSAFTQHPIMDLGNFKGKKVCFKDAVFPLLPRMIFGMYYNMPLVPGCQGSGLFKAFTEHLKHRLKIKENVEHPDIETRRPEYATRSQTLKGFVVCFEGPQNPMANLYMNPIHPNKVRVTLISRSTQFRKILNEDQLISSLKSFPDLILRKVNFNRHLSFMQQMEISYNTDILIGIHGAGLTHMLFMPEWGSVFEIFNCEDESCYSDLARLKGLKYLTWEKRDKLFPEDEGHHPTLGAHAKFTNYSFDVQEFLRIFKKALNHVKQHSALLNKKPVCNNTVHNEL